jgi:uncharacterized protein
VQIRKTVLTLAAAASASAASATPAELHAPGPNGPLSGTLTMAAENGAPVALIIPGSGPTDRNGDSRLGVKASTYRLLAEELAFRGVSTVRIDKRGMFGSAGSASDPNAVTIDDYVLDARNWIEAIKTRTGAGCVWLIGHSEGGLVALAAAQAGADVCGLVLVATAGRPLGQVLKEQLRAGGVDAPSLAQAEEAIDALAKGYRVDATRLSPALAPLFDPALQGFLMSAFRLDPGRLAAGIEKPVLIVQGARDIQVGVADAHLLKAALPSATLAVLPDVNHILKTVGTNDRAANVATYTDPNLPLAPGVSDLIAEFLLGRTR